MSATCIAPEKLYERDSQVRREDVRILQEWLKKQPHLPQLEETQVILFLHSCFYSIETAKTTIDAYFTRKTAYPDIFGCPGEETLKRILPVEFKKVMPKKTSEGYGILVAKLLDERPENYVFVHEALSINMVTALHFHRDGFDEGFLAIFDFKGASLGHLARVNLTALKHALDHMQEGMTLRLKGLHIVNAPFFMDKVLALVKPFVSQQIFEAIQIHSSLDSLYKHVPRELLPEDQGGCFPSCEAMQEGCVREIFDNLDFFRWHDSQIVDESKRPERSKFADANFGVEGTFKRLQID